MKRDFIPIQRIERAAYKVLADYGESYGRIAIPPIPVEEILECQLDLAMDFDDLAVRFGSDDVLGASFIDKGSVVFDMSLDPEENPQREGRYRFTVAHEAGHWVLHVPQILAERKQPTLFDLGEPPPPIVCRSSQSKEPREWQADSFAGFLLMPEHMIREAWQELGSDDGALNVHEEICELRGVYGLTDDELDPSCEAAKRMARYFNVSAQAMQIRLVGLKLLDTEPPQHGGIF